MFSSLNDWINWFFEINVSKISKFDRSKTSEVVPGIGTKLENELSIKGVEIAKWQHGSWLIPKSKTCANRSET